jgi:DNA-binding NtrC family response regulator
MRDNPTILLVDDEKPMLEWLGLLLEENGYAVTCFGSPWEALQWARENSPRILVTDIRMPGMTGLELFCEVKKANPEVAGIMITAFSSVETAVKAIREGVEDYIVKPFKADQLLLAIEKALNQRQVKTENALLRSQVKQEFDFSGIIGTSEPMLELLESVRKVADQPSTVLITGESGTGKELIARALHYNSHRADKPFLGVNCGSLSRNLLESELFGHMKGSFTGAHRDKEGLMTAAGEGTFFLDEISEMDRELQVKLLRALQERQIRPVGGNASLPFRARLVCATNRDLERMVTTGEFREDLYYRLNVIPLRVPSLRERRDDIRPLVEYFVKRSGFSKTFSEETLRILEDRSWPGNVRELENLVERLCVMTSEDVISPEHHPAHFRGRDRDEESEERHNGETQTMPSSLDEVEKAWILYTLEHRAGGNKTRAAELLGINPSTLHRKLGRYGLH